MALSNVFTGGSTTTASEKPIGTLQSEGLFYQPPVPTNSQAAGLHGTDGRGYTRSVGQSELASTHLNTMLDGNGKYIQNARRRGIEAANRRGMINSSIAGGNSERAAMEAASPFAMQAADAYGRAQTENLGYMNQNLMQERDIANEVLKEKMMADAARYAGRDAVVAAELAAQNEYRRFQEGLAFEGEQRGLDRAHDVGMSDMGYRQQRGLNEQGYGYDLGRQNNQGRIQGNLSYQDHRQAVARDNNTFSQQYNYETRAAIRDQNIRYSDAAFLFGLNQLDRDPSTRLSDVSGAMRFLGREGTLLIEDQLNGFGEGF